MIEEINEKVDALIKLFQTVQKQAQDNVTWHEQLEEYDRSLKNAKDDLYEREKSMARKELEVDQQKKYIGRANLELKEKEKALDTRENEMVKNKVVLEEMGVKQKELDNTLLKLEAKVKEGADTDKKAEDIARRETLLQKEIEMDRERKKAMDEDKEYITREKARLQILAQRLAR